MDWVLQLELAMSSESEIGSIEPNFAHLLNQFAIYMVFLLCIDLLVICGLMVVIDYLSGVKIEYKNAIVLNTNASYIYVKTVGMKRKWELL